MIKYGSVCSGIEAASVAWHSLGWEAQWYSEIDHFPSEVLKYRFPNVPNLGDMTQLTQNPIFNDKSINLLVGGTPCQSFSVAGLRKGLADPRGNLMLTFLSLADAKKPKWILWENVPGVLSSNGGKDFGTFLGALGELGYGFAYRVLDAQYVGGPGAVPQRRRRVFVVGCLGNWRAAAAVLFEQSCLSGDFKQSRKKGKKASGSPTQGVGGPSVPNVIGSLDTECGGGKLTHQSVNNGHLIPSWWNGEQTAPTLTCSNANGAQRMPDSNNLGAVIEPAAVSFAPSHYLRGFGPEPSEEISGTIKAMHNDQSPHVAHFRKVRRAKDSEDFETWEEDEKVNTINCFDQGDIRSTDVVVHAFKIRGGSEVETGEQGGTPGKRAGKGYLGQDEKAFTIGVSQDQQIMQPIALDTYNQTINRETTQTIRANTSTEHIGAVIVPKAAAFSVAKGAQSRTIGYREENAPTLVADTGNSHAVMHPIPVLAGEHPQKGVSIDVCPTLPAAMGMGGGHTPLVPHPVAYSFDSLASNSMKSSNPHSGCREVETSKTLDTTVPEPSKNQGGIAIAQPIAVDWRTAQVDIEKTGTLKTDLAKMSGPCIAMANPTVIDRAAFNQGPNAQYEPRIEASETMSSLVARGPHAVAQPIALAENTIGRQPMNGGNGDGFTEDGPMYTMNATGVHGVAQPMAFDWQSGGDMRGMNLQEKTQLQRCQTPAVLHSMAIRRLTPKECERLQGFPDDWTKIPYRNKPIDQCPDGPRYKACGNSMAVNVMHWIGKRISYIEELTK
jgi:site-specific DNA-cytosine methylase